MAGDADTGNEALLDFIEVAIMAGHDRYGDMNYIYANGWGITQHDVPNEKLYFCLHDRLGSVRLVIDTDSNVQNRYIYQPFGELHENNPADFDENVAACGSFRFTGQYYDSEIDQYYLRARQYYPYIGRFTSRDPVFGQLENPLTLHRYLYCRNDPVNQIDPQGLVTFHVQLATMFSFGNSYMGQFGFALDLEGNFGLMLTTSANYENWREPPGWGTPGASLGVAIGVTSADTIFDLEGYGWSLGSTVGVPLLGQVTVDFLVGRQRSGAPYLGVEVTPGWSATAWEAHVQHTHTIVIPWKEVKEYFNEWKKQLEESVFGPHSDAGSAWIWSFM
jgi:RHS repeat-associated protein